MGSVVNGREFMTHSINSGQRVSLMTVLCILQSLWSSVFSDGVFHIIDLLRVGADTASQQGERFDSLTLMRGRELESI